MMLRFSLASGMDSTLMILSSKGASLRSALLRPDDDECRTECREVTKPPIKARHDAGKDRRWRVKDGATHILDREFGVLREGAQLTRGTEACGAPNGRAEP